MNSDQMSSFFHDILIPIFQILILETYISRVRTMYAFLIKND